MKPFLFTLFTLLILTSCVSAENNIDLSSSLVKSEQTIIEKTDNLNLDLYSIRFENGYIGYVDKDGNTILEPQSILEPLYYRHGKFCEGLLPVRESENGLIGYIDKNGDYVIEPQFSYADNFYNNMAKVEDLNENQVFIDKQGNKICDIKWEHEYVKDSDGKFHEDLLVYPFGELRKYLKSYGEIYEKDLGYIDINGNIIIDAIYQ